MPASRNSRARLLSFVTAAAIAPLAVASIAGCGDGDSASPGTGDGTATLPQGSAPVDLDPATFSAEIDNTWWPMKPGTRWTYAEIDADGNKSEVVVTATSGTKRLANGITARVVRDTVSERGELVEDTFDWYAQDEAGNVWYMGEDTAEFEGGKQVSTAGAWEAGVDGAEPGVAMPGNPEDGMQYRQEYYAGEAEDEGEILGTSEMVQVPYGRFQEAVLTRDTTPLEPRVAEYKLYAPDIGPVATLDVSGPGGGREELVRFTTVDAATAKAAGTTPLGEAYP